LFSIIFFSFLNKNQNKEMAANQTFGSQFVFIEDSVTKIKTVMRKEEVLQTIEMTTGGCTVQAVFSKIIETDKDGKVSLILSMKWKPLCTSVVKDSHNKIAEVLAKLGNCACYADRGKGSIEIHNYCGAVEVVTFTTKPVDDCFAFLDLKQRHYPTYEKFMMLRDSFHTLSDEEKVINTLTPSLSVIGAGAVVSNVNISNVTVVGFSIGRH
jgi:hypothetical protein